mmetsp:Transcript_10201/g.7186  ORF Transcript_10201/g.7186 Transcript_10201/m.7186 type:complete len:122 (-) Transcript_10201:762-1127(-)
MYEHGAIAMIFMLSMYFLLIELNQVWSVGIGYLMSPWNYIDLTPPILNLIVIFCAGMNAFSNIYALQAVTALCMWLKLLYFLRMFKLTGYLVNMILQVIQDMGAFFILLFIFLLAFSQGFL